MKNSLPKADHFRQFFSGLTRPSLTGLCGTVAVGLITLALGILFITPDRLAGRAGDYMLSGPSDEYASLTIKALRLERVSSPIAGVAVIGDSSVREAISSRDELREMLEQDIHHPASAWLLAGGGLRHWEAAALTDQLPGHFKGVVVLQISPEALSLAPDFLAGLSRSRRLAVDSAAFDQELRIAGLAIPRRCGNYFLDHAQFFLARPRILVNLASHPVTLSPHMADHWRSPTPQEWARVISNMTEWEMSYFRNRDANLAVYGRMIRRLQHAGIQVALVEELRSPRAEAAAYASPEARQKLLEYQSDVRKFAGEHGIAWWDLGASAQLRDEDFMDHTHLRNPRARERFTRALAQRAAALLAGRDAQTEVSR